MHENDKISNKENEMLFCHVLFISKYINDVKGQKISRLGNSRTKLNIRELLINHYLREESLCCTI